MGAVSDETIAGLVAALDDDPNPLHADFTPSVMALIEAGLPGALAVLGRLDAAGRTTRLHAQRVLEGVAMRRLGWVPGRGYPDGAAGEARTRHLLAANGAYHADAPEAARADAVAKWRAWLDAEAAGASP